MEEIPTECRKHVPGLFDSLVYSCSESSLSLISTVESSIDQYNDTNPPHQKKGGYLTRLIEKKQLKEKSLSKKVKTPLDRKLYRTCWPVELGKVTKIKKKPTEKKRKKPTVKSFRNKKITSSSQFSVNNYIESPFFSNSIKNLEEISFTECLRKCHFLYEPITPELLLYVLRDPEYIESGATVDAIISKLRALNLHLNPAQDLLKRELLQKLKCGVKLGLVIEKKGLFKVSEAYGNKKLSKRKTDAFWTLWYKDIPCKKP